ncbi:hypothetical protein KAR91_05760 [Candidatus Pacearchaeota archaeon]|nr:hypothetical protein [Candidatus Pacearchaeota archaeon]
MTKEDDDNQSVEVMHKDSLIKLLKHMTELVENDDSLSGYIGYSFVEKKVIISDDNRNDYEVKCVFRSGNKDGQGFMTFIPDISKEENEDKEN